MSAPLTPVPVSNKHLIYGVAAAVTIISLGSLAYYFFVYKPSVVAAGNQIGGISNPGNSNVSQPAAKPTIVEQILNTVSGPPVDNSALLVGSDAVAVTYFPLKRMLNPHETNMYVKQLQAYLNSKFNAKLDVDGNLGAHTVAAMQNFLKRSEISFAEYTSLIKPAVTA